MRSLLVNRQRRMLRGWIKWIPVVAIPFAVLFTHAWLNIQILRADYVLRELDKEVKTLQEELRHAGVVQDVHQEPERLAAQAAALGFVAPKPGQQEFIPYDPAAPLAMPDEAGFEMAQRAPESAERPAPPARDTVDRAATPAPQTPDQIPAPAPARPVALEAASPTGVWAVLDEAAAEPAAAPAQEPERPAVVLELPVDAYVEELPGTEADMGSLEVL